MIFTPNYPKIEIFQKKSLKYQFLSKCAKEIWKFLLFGSLISYYFQEKYGNVNFKL